MDNTANTNEPAGIEAGVIECQDAPDEWLVEAVDHGSEGEIYRVIFSGPRARELALEYAATKYGHNGIVMPPQTFMDAPPRRPTLRVIERDDLA